MSARRHLCLGLVLFVAAGGCHGPAPVAPAGAVAVAPAPPAPPPPSSPRPRAAPPPRPEPAAAPPARRESAVQRRKLPGGAQLIVESDPLASTVAIATFVTAVAAAETEPGSRHLLERLLLDRESPSGLLAARLRARGSEVVSFTAPDYTLYQVVTPRVLWKGALDLTTSLLAEPPLGAAALASQRQAVQSELAQAPGDGEALRRLLAARAPDHPYQRPLLGTLDSLGRLSSASLRLLHQRYYRPDQLTVVVVGDVAADEVAAQLSTRLAAQPAEGIAPPPPPPVQLVAGPRVAVFDSPAAQGQSELLLGFAIPAAPALTAAELAALDVAAVALGQRSSRESFLVSGLLPGALVLRAPLPVGGAVAQSVSESARAALTAALQLAARRLPAGELERAQRRLVQASLQRGELPGGRAQRLGAFALLGIDEAAYETSLRALTPFELQATLRRYLTLENLTLAVAAPRRSSPAIDPNRLSALIATTAATVARSAAPPASEPVRTERQAQLYRLRSGARVVLLPDERVKTVAVAALWPGGQRLEDERLAGLHELLARAWPRTLRLCSSLAPSEAAVPLVAEAGPDSFGLRLQLLSSDLETTLASWRDCLEHPLLSDADLERARRGLLTESGLRSSGPARPELESARLAWRLLRSGLLGSHPYASAGQPTEASLVGLTRRRLLDFYHQHYGREHLVLAVVGDIAPAALLGELEPWLGPATPATAADFAKERLLHDPVPGPLPQPSVAALPGQLFQSGPGQQAHLVLGFPAPGRRALLPGRSEPDRAAVELLLELLAPSADEGRLPQALLARRGLVRSFEAQLSAGVLPGYLAFYLTTAPGQLEVAEATLRDELHRLVDHPVAAEELAAARERLLARRARLAQRRPDRASSLALAAALGLPDRLLTQEDPEGQLLAVDAQAVQAAAAAVLREERLLRVAVLPAPLAPSPTIDPSKGRLVASRAPVPLPPAKKPRESANIARHPAKASHPKARPAAHHKK